MAGDPTRRWLLAAGLLMPPLARAGAARAADALPAHFYDPTPAGGADAAREAKLPADAPVLYVVSAPDCTFCAQWRAQDFPGFEASPARARLRFVVLHSRSFAVGSGQDATWPAELRWVRAGLLAAKVAMYTPTWALVRGHDFLAGASGLRDWTQVMLPAIRKATA